LNHAGLAPSPWIERWWHLVAPGATVLDVACGPGRHMRFAAGRGHAVTGVDRSPEALDAAARYGRVLLADIENGPWPFAGQTFGAVIVTHYLWRALLPAIVAAVAPGGVLFYETFAAGNETVGKPSRPEFLLRPGELLAACANLQIVTYENGFLSAPERFIQRIAAVRPVPSPPGPPPRHGLEAPDQAVDQ
jgi:SAM-dependent methyltransferase